MEWKRDLVANQAVNWWLASPAAIFALTFALTFALAFAALLPRPASANSFGVDTSVMTFVNIVPLPGCGAGVCHSAAAEDVMVTIEGPTEIAVGEPETYTISITGELTGFLGAGLSVHAVMNDVLTAMDRGLLEEDGPAMRISSGSASGQVTHVSLGQITDRYSYEFTVVADEVGTLELRGAMNAFNAGNQLTTKWNRTELMITVPEPGATASGLAMLTSLGMARSVRRRRADSR